MTAERVSTVLLRLARVADLADARPAAFDAQSALCAVADAGPLRATVARLTRERGLRGAFGLATELSGATFSPALSLLERSPSVSALAERWQVLEAAWGVRHRTALRVCGDGLSIDCQPSFGAAAPLTQNLMICGALVGLLRGLGHEGVGLAAWPGRRGWVDLVEGSSWCLRRDWRAEGATRFRLSWAATKARAHADRPLVCPEAHPRREVRAILEAWDREPAERWSPRRLAETVGLSPRTLHRRLRATGIVGGALQRAARIRAACELLARTDRAVTELAHHLGFSDAAHFSRDFRTASGLSPRRYRAACGIG